MYVSLILCTKTNVLLKSLMFLLSNKPKRESEKNKTGVKLEDKFKG